MNTKIIVEIYSDELDEVSASELIKKEAMKISVPGVTIVNAYRQGSSAGNLIDNLKKKHVTKGTLVKINVPEGHRLTKYNGMKGKIHQISSPTSPYPIIRLDESGIKLAVELRHLIYPQQTSIF